MKDSAGAKVITTSELIARTYRGETITVNGGWGKQTITRLDDGYYSVDGHGHHSLEGLQEWLGFYHYEFGTVVFNPGD